MQEELKSWPVFGILTVAIMGLLGYLPGLQLLGSIRGDYIPMAPSTAVCFIVLGIVLITSSSSFKIKPVFLLLMTLFVALFGILEPVGYLSGLDLNFENTLVTNAGELKGVPIALMSPATGTVFFYFWCCSLFYSS